MNDLIKQALAAFEALSPEDQHIMREEQRKSFAENNAALSQGEGVPVLTHRRYWTLEEYKIWKGLDEKIAQWATSTHQFHFSEYEQAQEMLDYISGNVPSGVYRIAPRYYEAQSEQCLETIGYQYQLRSGDWCRDVSKYPYETMERSRALVDRENAIAMIADRDAKIRALEKSVADGWLPIESVPRDGTLVDLWFVSGFYNADGAWQIAVEFRVTDVSWNSDKWVDTDGNNHEDVTDFPDAVATHWRHRPASPGASE